MELGNVVRFSNHPRPFLVSDTYCINPDCCCNAVVLTFTEVNDSGQSLKNPFAFSARVDLESWEERDPPPRSPEIAAWVREFLDQCPPARRADFKASYEEGKWLARRKAEYTIDADEVLEGLLVSYANIVNEKGALSAGGNGYTFNVHYKGRKFFVEDSYCANPRCDCQSVHLEFFESVAQRDAEPRIYQRFMGRATFAGELMIEKAITCSPAEAKAVLSAWWQACHADLEMLEERYHEVKQIAQRNLDAQPSRHITAWQTPPSSTEEMFLDYGPALALDDELAANTRVGRNALCPCGSGKKYKKCCGRK